MKKTTLIHFEISDNLAAFRLPQVVQRRLNSLLNRQDKGQTLSTEERSEAEGLVDLTDFLALVKLRTERYSGQS